MISKYRVCSPSPIRRLVFCYVIADIQLHLHITQAYKSVLKSKKPRIAKNIFSLIKDTMLVHHLPPAGNTGHIWWLCNFSDLYLITLTPEDVLKNGYFIKMFSMVIPPAISRRRHAKGFFMRSFTITKTGCVFLYCSCNTLTWASTDVASSPTTHKSFIRDTSNQFTTKNSKLLTRFLCLINRYLPIMS